MSKKRTGSEVVDGRYVYWEQWYEATLKVTVCMTGVLLLLRVLFLLLPHLLTALSTTLHTSPRFLTAPTYSIASPPRLMPLLAARRGPYVPAIGRQVYLVGTQLPLVALAGGSMPAPSGGWAYPSLLSGKPARPLG